LIYLEAELNATEKENGMSKLGVATVADEVGLVKFPGTTRNLSVKIDPAKSEMTIANPELRIGNGNRVIWEVGSISGYLVEIDLKSPAVSLILVQVAGTTQVLGNVEMLDPMSPGGPVSYSVFLRKFGETSRTKLTHVPVLMPLTTGLATEPRLVIDRMGDPPDTCLPDTREYK
jgi:hypothetical protein